MPSPITFSVEDYFNEFADSSAMAEAARFRTIPTGTYTMQVTKREGTYFKLADGGYWTPVFGEGDEQVDSSWRKGVRLSANVMNAEGKKLQMVRVDASWEAKRDGKTGELDKLFKKWEQIVRALYPTLKAEERAQKGVGEVLQALSLYPIGAYITEAFHVPAIDGSKKWKTPRSEEETKQYREAGYEAKNFVVSITKV